MANIKIAQLTNKTTLADTDLVIVESATQTQKMTIANLKETLGVNAKAGRVTGSLIDIPLTSGWTGTLRVRRNDLGIAEISTTFPGLKVGTKVKGTVVATLPAGYGPTDRVAITVNSGTVNNNKSMPALALMSDGTLVVTTNGEAELVAAIDLRFAQIYYCA